MIRIQVKVYDETGRRQYANDIKIPINLEEALEYVKEESKQRFTALCIPRTESEAKLNTLNERFLE